MKLLKSFSTSQISPPLPSGCARPGGVMRTNGYSHIPFHTEKCNGFILPAVNPLSVCCAAVRFGTFSALDSNASVVSLLFPFFICEFSLFGFFSTFMSHLWLPGDKSLKCWDNISNIRQSPKQTCGRRFSCSVSGLFGAQVWQLCGIVTVL